MNNATNDTTPNEERRPLAETSGYQYMAEYILPEYTEEMHTGWMADIINRGQLLVCPQCHFLRLPRAPFAWDHHLVSQHGDPGEAACDVCFHAVTIESLGFSGEPLIEILDRADSTLDELRARRAQVLYDLYHSAADGAEALLLQTVAERVRGLRLISQETAALAA